MAKKRTRVYRHTGSQTRPVIRFRFKVVILIFLLVYAACFAIYMMGMNIGTEKSVGNFSAENNISSESDEKEEKKSDEIINPVPANDEALSETYFGRCAFVGDSISVGLADYQYVTVKNVLAEVGMNIERINTETMQTAYGNVTALEALTEMKPQNVYIMLGSNGIEWLEISDMMEQYSTFVDGVKAALPEAKIYVLAIPPVTAQREEAAEKPIKNSDIDKYNSELLAMANEKKIYYVDINTAMKGNDGKFPSENAAEDGMHFQKETYQIMLDYILSHTAD